jgi:hypothetical protein
MGSYVYSVCQSPDKKYLLCAGYSTAKAFRIDDWTEVWHLGSQYTAGVISRACFTDDMKYIICSFSASQSYGAIIRMFPFK